MPRRYRVFAGSSAVDAAALDRHVGAAGHYRGDDLGWFHGVWGAPPLVVDRYLTAEDDLRRELNAWAAWLEAAGRGDLLERMIATAQLFVLSGDAAACRSACRFLAAAADGIYQIDDAGFFAADGTPLAPEDSP